MTQYPIPQVDPELQAFLEYLLNTISELQLQIKDLQAELSGTNVNISTKSKQTLSKN